MSTTTRQDPEEESLPAAHSLQEAANSDNTLEGYAAMNNPAPDSEIVHEVLEHPADTAHHHHHHPHHHPHHEHSEIAHRAYLLYLERGGGDGLDQQDWFLAEEEVKNRPR